MKSIEIDVVVPVFNGDGYLADTLRSIQNQTLAPSRIIIADDGSSDRTADVAETFMQSDLRITYLKLPHKGVSAARNSGIEASNAPFIAFIDADDIWLPTKLEYQAAVFDVAAPDTGFVHSSYFCINADGDVMPNAHVFPPKQRGDIFMPLLTEGYVLSGSASSVLVKRSVLDMAGYFDEKLFHGEDWDLWIRLARISKVDFTPEAVVGIRVHDKSAQRRVQDGRTLSFFHQQMLVYSKWDAVVTTDNSFKKTLQKGAIDAVIPAIKHLRLVHAFYRKLSTSDSSLIRSLFPTFLHFWSKISFRVLIILAKRVKAKWRERYVKNE
jgi:glycosyltransferase involved in cell wall biosynthesis